MAKLAANDGRFLRMPIGSLLVGIGGCKNYRFAIGTAGNLQPRGKPSFEKPQGTVMAGVPKWLNALTLLRGRLCVPATVSEMSAAGSRMVGSQQNVDLFEDSADVAAAFANAFECFDVRNRFPFLTRSFAAATKDDSSGDLSKNGF